MHVLFSHTHTHTHTHRETDTERKYGHKKKQVNSYLTVGSQVGPTKMHANDHDQR